MSQLTHAPAAQLDTKRAGAVAGLVAGPVFLAAVAANTWASIDFLRSLGWQLVGGKNIPWPSSLAAGPYGWLQITAFFVAGCLIVLFAQGLRRALPARRSAVVAVVALTIAGLAIAASAFPVDAAMIETGDPSTWHGWIHGVAFLVALPSILFAPVATALALRGDRHWRPFGWLCVAATPVMLALLLLPLGNAGFYLFLTTAFGWIFALAARLRHP
ncbi:MAG TPA: DUF998 domain-containing protein [Micromonosporaceae bacterium]|nr:DUF998 domain-containing protein [Micromonosporaceae bacterium]